MKTDETLTREYLAAVEREASALPPVARQELIADLGEHIEVALAERPGSVREILQEVGDPRVIAATALQELGGTPAAQPRKPARRRSPAWLPPVLLVAGALVPYLGNVLVDWIALAALVAAVVIVCRARYWTVGQKWAVLTLAVFLPAVAHVIWYWALPDDGTVAEPWVRWSLIVLELLVRLASAVWLWRNRRP